MRKRQRKKLRKRFPSCLPEYSHYENEFECGYGSAIACDHCVCLGGNIDPRTDQVMSLRGLKNRYHMHHKDEVIDIPLDIPNAKGYCS